MERNVEKHESFGLVGFSRCTGGALNLFGSSIQHGVTIRLSIKRAVRERDLSRDWIFGKEELVEVWLSTNQFSDLITSMNVGEGVPCTIRYVNGKTMEPCPSTEQREKFVEEFDSHVHRSMGQSAALASKARAMLSATGPITKAQRNEIVEMLDSLMRDIQANMPFVHEQFNEAMDKTVTEAKAEVEGFVNAKIQSLGISALESEIAKAITAPVQSKPLQLAGGMET